MNGNREDWQIRSLIFETFNYLLLYSKCRYYSDSFQMTNKIHQFQSEFGEFNVSDWIALKIF